MEVYAWARRHPGFVMAVKGRHAIATNQLIGSPSWQDVTVNGRKLKKGVRLWNVGTSMAKLELFGDLEKEKPVDGEDYPDGYVYLPDGTSDEWIKQLVAEELRIIRLRSGGFRREWHKVRDRNEALDNAVYARAVAFSLGVDRWRDTDWLKARGDFTPPAPPAPAPKQVPDDRPAPASQPAETQSGGKRLAARPKKPNPFTSSRRR